MDDRWIRIADGLAESERGALLEDRGCSLAVSILGVDRSAVTITLGSTTGRTSGSDETARSLDEQQYLVGDGPAIACRTSDWPIMIDDVAASVEDSPGFCEVAGALGVSAAFSFPLRVGAGRVGTLTGYRDRPGPLTDGQYADGLVLASVLTTLLLARMSEAVEVPLDGPDPALDAQATVQRAAGMVSEQLGLSIVDALVLLRSHAFAHGTTVRDVADQVLDRSLDLGGQEES